MVERIGGWLNGFIDWIVGWRIFDSAGRPSSKLFIVAAVFTLLAIHGVTDDSTGQIVLFGILAAIAVVRGMDEKRGEAKEFLSGERREKSATEGEKQGGTDIWD